MDYTQTELYYDISRSKWISRDNDVTMVFALNRIAARIRIFSRNALRYVNFGCLPSAVQSLTTIYKRNFEISWNFYMKAIIRAYTEHWTLCKQICCLLDVSETFLQLILSTNVPCTFSKALEVGRLTRFRTTGTYMRQGETQCWALIAICKSTFTKTTIKSKFVDRVLLKVFRSAID